MDTTTTMNEPFAIGDLVRVIDGTHDPSMPESRTGLIVEVVKSSRRHKKTALYRVLFGTKILCFHPMWLEAVT